MFRKRNSLAQNQPDQSAAAAAAAATARGHYEPTQLDKRIMKASITGHSPTSVATEINPRENEYASMKYYMPRPDGTCYDEQWSNQMRRDFVMAGGAPYSDPPGAAYHSSASFNNNAVGGHGAEKEHIYESPESVRRHLTQLQGTTPDHAHGPQYFDLDPSVAESAYSRYPQHPGTGSVVHSAYPLSKR